MLRYVIQHNISITSGLLAPTHNKAANEQWIKMAPIKPPFWCFSKFPQILCPMAMVNNSKNLVKRYEILFVLTHSSGEVWLK